MRLLPLVALVPVALPAQSPPELLRIIETASDPAATQAAVKLQLRGAEALPLLPDLVDAWLAADSEGAQRLELPLLTLVPHSAEAAQRRLAEILEHRNDELEQVDRAVRLLDFLDRTAAPSPELRELLIACTEQPEAGIAAHGEWALVRQYPRSAWARDRIGDLVDGSRSDRLWAVHLLRNLPDAPERVAHLPVLVEDRSVLVRLGARFLVDRNEAMALARAQAKRKDGLQLIPDAEDPGWQRAWRPLIEWALDEGDPFLRGQALRGLATSGTRVARQFSEDLKQKLVEPACAGNPNAIKALVNARLAGVPHLLRCVPDADPAARAAILEGLGVNGASAAPLFEEACRILDCGDPRVRQSLVGLAAATGVDDPRLDAWVLELLARDDEEGCSYAVAKLRSLPEVARRQRRAIQLRYAALPALVRVKLLAVLVELGLDDDRLVARLHADLAASRDARVVIRLLGLAEGLPRSPSLFETLLAVSRRGAPHCRVTAAELLLSWPLSDAEATALLVPMLADRSVASWALDRLAPRGVDDAAVARSLVPLLRSPRHRERAMRLLTAMDSLSDALPALIGLLRDEALTVPTARRVFGLLVALGPAARPAGPAVRGYLERSGRALQVRGAEVLVAIEGK